MIHQEIELIELDINYSETVIAYKSFEYLHELAIAPTNKNRGMQMLEFYRFYSEVINKYSAINRVNNQNICISIQMPSIVHLDVPDLAPISMRHFARMILWPPYGIRYNVNWFKRYSRLANFIGWSSIYLSNAMNRLKEVNEARL